MTTATLPARIQSLTPASIGGINIKTVAQRPAYFNMMVYGKSGVGKTWLAGSSYAVPEMRRVLFLDVEGGILTLRKDFPQIETVRVETWAQVQSVYNELRAGGHGFQTVILDSLTEIQKFNMSDIMKKLIDKNDDRDMDVPSLREWGKNLEQIRRFVRAFRDLPLNVFFTALEREDKDRLQRPVKLPALSGKMAHEVAAFLDIVLYYSIKEMEGEKGVKQVRVLQSAATESCTAKDRSGLLPPVMVDPTMEKLYDLIIRKTGGTFNTPGPKQTIVTDAVVVEDPKPTTEAKPVIEPTTETPKPEPKTTVTDTEIANLPLIKEN